jgi:hypothetical protein
MTSSRRPDTSGLMKWFPDGSSVRFARRRGGCRI